jgi:hypothetical protein
MPHPKNRLKLTGDTHLPGRNLDLDLMDDDEAGMDPVAMLQEPEPRVYADGYVPPEPMLEAAAEPAAEPSTMDKVEDKVGKQAAKSPWLAAGAAVAFGFLVMRMLRR